MKNLNKIILTSAVIFGLNSCGDKLERYNLENKQVYQDFVEFIKENKWDNRFYSNKEDTRYTQVSKEKIFLVNKTKDMEIRFTDYGFNGMDDLDFYVENELKNPLKYLSPEKQIAVAKRYTRALKRIMHEEKFKEY